MKCDYCGKHINFVYYQQDFGITYKSFCSLWHQIKYNFKMIWKK
jgi:hypothetical protein